MAFNTGTNILNVFNNKHVNKSTPPIINLSNQINISPKLCKKNNAYKNTLDDDQWI